MIYEWDSKKNQANITKHDVDFEMVYKLDWSTVTEFVDTRIESEERMVAWGVIEDRLYVLVYTVRNENCRVISLRKANNREVSRYEQA